MTGLTLIPILPSRKHPLMCDRCGCVQEYWAGAQIPGPSPRMYLDVRNIETVCAHCIWGGDPERN